MTRQFKIIFIIGLVLSIGIKALSFDNLQNPQPSRVAEESIRFFEGKGFQAGGLTSFFGHVSLILRRDACVIYAVPVAPQGWNESAIRAATDDSQSVWFLFDGEIWKDHQPTWNPMIQYYLAKSLRYLGFSVGYRPLFAIVASHECSISAINWKGLGAVNFDVRNSRLFSQ